jgi:hypothetical protein
VDAPILETALKLRDKKKANGSKHNPAIATPIDGSQ